MKAVILLSDEEKELVKEATAECRLRIQHDQARTSPRVKRLLIYLEHHLYDKFLTVSRWKAACDVRSNTFEAKFQADLAFTPYAYVTERRLETAARLLLEPSPKVWQVASLVGYSDIAVFSRAFKRWAKMRPIHFRQTEGAKARRSSSRHSYSRAAVEWRLVLGGDVELPRLLARCSRLDDLCPAGPTRHATERLHVDRELLEKGHAERIWAAIKDRSSLERIALVGFQGNFETTAFFDLLREKSREEGRSDRRRGIEVAELALQSLAGCAETLGDVTNLRALGWITLANARRLAFDFIGSNRDFEFAEELWRKSKEPDPVVEAELCLFKAALRWFQRSFKDGLKLVDRSSNLFVQLDRPVFLAQALILKANIGEEHTGDSQLTASRLHEALQLLKRTDQPYLRYAALTGLTRAYWRLGDYKTATSWLSRAVDLYQSKLRYPFGRYQLLWLEALLQQAQGRDQRAIDMLEDALHGFVELGENSYGAMVALDLAVSYTKRGLRSKAIAAASFVVPMLKSIQIRREAMAALKLLRDLVARDRINVECLLEIRNFIESIVRDPLARKALADCKVEGRELAGLLQSHCRPFYPQGSPTG